MFPSFLTRLRANGLNISITEYLALLGAMQAGVANYNDDIIWRAPPW